jgi:hypothetical protein
VFTLFPDTLLSIEVFGDVDEVKPDLLFVSYFRRLCAMLEVDLMSLSRCESRIAMRDCLSKYCHQVLEG